MLCGVMHTESESVLQFLQGLWCDHGQFGLRHAGLGRPAGHADTPLDDQQAMLGLHAVACYFSRLTRDACLSARPTRSVT